MNAFMTGFAKLRPGCIHLICPRCKRKMSNVQRADYDPKRAAVAVVWCERCAQGGFCEGPDGYWDARGEWLTDEECENASVLEGKA